MINGIAFERTARMKDYTLFVTSIYEIDKRLEELRTEEPEPEPEPEPESEEEMLRRTVPVEYHDLIDVFSKEAADQMPPHRAYDHKIKLESDVLLGYSPL